MKRFTPHAAMLLSILLLQWSVPASSQSPAPVSSQARLQDLAGKVRTVNGPIDPSALGVTLMHEHIFIDLNDPIENPDTWRWMSTAPPAGIAAVESTGDADARSPRVVRRGYQNQDDFLLTDERTAHQRGD